MISYLFVFLMMVIGGVIGYLADSWGHKIGKKRLSFLGLRPRHTATLVTVGAGVLIPLVTVIIVAVVSSDVRAWLLHGAQAIRESKELTQQVGDLQKQRTGLNAEINKKSEEARKADEVLKMTEGRLKEFQARAKDFQERAQQAYANAAILSNRAKAVSAQLRTRQAELAAAKSNLAKLKRDVAKSETDYREAYKQLQDSYDDHRRLDDENKALGKQLEGIRAELKEAQDEKDAADADLRSAKERVADYQERMNKEIARNTELLNTGRAELERMWGLLAEAEARLYADLNASRTQPIIFHFQEEVARVPVESNRTADQVWSALEALLRSARLTAERHGAKARDKGQVADLFPVRTKQGASITVEELENSLVKFLTGKNESCVLVAYSALNCFQGEPVMLAVQILPNPLVYRTGQVIAETRIDGKMDDEAVAEAVKDFLRVKVVERAKADHMIPVKGHEDAFATVTPDALLAIVKQIRAAGGRIRVRVVATKDIRAADPLKFDLVVRYP